jgi:pimeloyl-ACP methyl ester carboxylesterase
MNDASSELPLVLFPGLGADQRLYDPQREALGEQLILPAWLVPERHESLATFAPRVVRAALGADISKPYVLGGISFGGMVALEAVKHLPAPEQPAAVVIISGLRSNRGLTAAFKFQARLLPLIPNMLLGNTMRAKVAKSFIRRDGLTGQAAELVRAMARDIDMPFFRWSVAACAGWAHNGACPVPVYQIHGTRDRIIPFVSEPDLSGEPTLIADGGHLINLSEPDIVNRFLRETLNHVPRPTDGPSNSPTIAPKARDSLS